MKMYFYVMFYFYLFFLTRSMCGSNPSHMRGQMTFFVCSDSLGSVEQTMCTLFKYH
uniref:Uncharacterized protein n=1 Tax=Anguilla anguilla TaxID=7936 RepID=A0A0E9QSJ8_ANGAN